MTDPVLFQKSPMPIEVEDGKTYFWCACGKSATQPLCVGSLSKIQALAGIVASVRASAPARNNRRSVGDTDGRDTSFGSEFSRSHILFISIQKIAKSIRTGLLQKIPDDLGFLTNLDQTDGE